MALSAVLPSQWFFRGGQTQKSLFWTAAPRVLDPDRQPTVMAEEIYLPTAGCRLRPPPRYRNCSWQPES